MPRPCCCGRAPFARTCESFADFLDGHTGSDDRDGQARIRELRDRALEVHDRQLASQTIALPRLEGESTQPGLRRPGRRG